VDLLAAMMADVRQVLARLLAQRGAGKDAADRYALSLSDQTVELMAVAFVANSFHRAVKGVMADKDAG
jgi:hypothetical protein